MGLFRELILFLGGLVLFSRPQALEEFIPSLTFERIVVRDGVGGYEKIRPEHILCPALGGLCRGSHSVYCVTP